MGFFLILKFINARRVHRVFNSFGKEWEVLKLKRSQLSQ